MSIKDKESVQWWQINNLVPILATFVGMALTYGFLLTRVSILETKMDLVLAGQEKVISSANKQEAKTTALEIRITALETVNSFKR